jgi:hypothetical protein
MMMNEIDVFSISHENRFDRDHERNRAKRERDYEKMRER